MSQPPYRALAVSCVLEMNLFREALVDLCNVAGQAALAAVLGRLSPSCYGRHSKTLRPLEGTYPWARAFAHRASEARASEPPGPDGKLKAYVAAASASLLEGGSLSAEEAQAQAESLFSGFTPRGDGREGQGSSGSSQGGRQALPRAPEPPPDTAGRLHRDEDDDDGVRIESRRSRPTRSPTARVLRTPGALPISPV